MSALVEEAVTVGDVVRLFTFRQGDANLVELTLPSDSPYAGTQLGDVMWPPDVSLVTVLRDGRVLTPDPDRAIEAGDELLFVAAPEHESEIEQLLSPHSHTSS
jgi:trk system potassium uptake protein TrkA